MPFHIISQPLIIGSITTPKSTQHAMLINGLFQFCNWENSSRPIIIGKFRDESENQERFEM
jgi:hypothetical protein